MKKLLLIFALILIPSCVLAAPGIQSVSGSVSDGETITISSTGTNFGTKSTAAPVSFCDFDGGTNGAEIDETGWTVYAGGDAPVYSNTRSISGSYSSLHNPDGVVSANYTQSSIYRSDVASTVFYLTFWHYAQSTGISWYRGSKMFRYSHDNLPEAVLVWGGSNSHLTLLDNNGQTLSGYPEFVGAVKGAWERIEFVFGRGTNGGEDAWWYFRRLPLAGGPVEYSDSGLDFLIDSDYPILIRVGSEFHGNDSPGYWCNWIDNLYVDKTQARVEIGDNSAFSSCTKRAIIVPSAWSTSSITATVAVDGIFAVDDPAYVFVVDSNGDASSGFPVTIGGGTPNNAPAGTITTPASCPATVETATTTVAGGATDSDGTIASVGWENLTTSASSSCTADDGTFDENNDPYTCSSVSLQEGANTIRITVTDDDSAVDTVDCVITYDSGSDITAPSLVITSHTGGSVNEVGTFLVTVSGTLTDETATDRVEVSCPNCTNVSAVTGVDTWSVDLTLPVATLGSDQLQASGDFVDDTGWYIGSGCEVTGGQLVCSGGSGYWTITADAQASLGDVLRTDYEIVSYTSGDLIESQYGFAGLGNSTYLLTSVESHHKNTKVVEENNFAFTFYNFNGILDNITVKPIGSSCVATITGYDTSDNSDTDVVIFIYTSLNPVAVQVTEGSDITIPTGSDITWTLTPVE